VDWRRYPCSPKYLCNWLHSAPQEKCACLARPLGRHPDGEKVKPGLKANLIVEAYPESAFRPGAAAGRISQLSLGVLRAIPIEVPRLGRLASGNPKTPYC